MAMTIADMHPHVIDWQEAREAFVEEMLEMGFGEVIACAQAAGLQPVRGDDEDDLQYASRLALALAKLEFPLTVEEIRRGVA